MPEHWSTLGSFDGTASSEAKGAITGHGAEKGWARSKVTYRLRDWADLTPALLGLPHSRHPLR